MIKKFAKCIFVCFFVINFSFVYANVQTPETASDKFTLSDFDWTKRDDEIQTFSEACILINCDSGKILYDKNSRKKMFPASTTKIMTAILTLEKCNLSDVATVSKNAVESIPYSYSTANLQVGEQLTIEQLLYLLLLPSANDAAVVLAEFIGGSVENFASMMNDKASELGCINSHFVNPNGIHYVDSSGKTYLDHFSCAYDLALIGRYAMQNAKFRSIVSTTSYKLPATNLHPADDRNFLNSNLLLHNPRPTLNYYYEYCTGIKTGYTDPAGNCIVASSKKDGIEYIAVVLKGDDMPNGLDSRYVDCKTLFDYAFNNFSVRTIKTASTVLKQISIFNGSADTKNLDVLIKSDISAYMSNSVDIESLHPIVEINPILGAPIKMYDVVGKVSYVVDGKLYSSELLAGSNVEVSRDFYICIGIVFVILILFVVYMAIRKKTKPDFPDFEK